MRRSSVQQSVQSSASDHQQEDSLLDLRNRRRSSVQRSPPSSFPIPDDTRAEPIFVAHSPPRRRSFDAKSPMPGLAEFQRQQAEEAARDRDSPAQLRPEILAAMEARQQDQQAMLQQRRRRSSVQASSPGLSPSPSRHGVDADGYPAPFHPLQQAIGTPEAQAAADRAGRFSPSNPPRRRSFGGRGSPSPSSGLDSAQRRAAEGREPHMFAYSPPRAGGAEDLDLQEEVLYDRRQSHSPAPSVHSPSHVIEEVVEERYVVRRSSDNRSGRANRRGST